VASISCAYFYRRDWHSIAVGLECQLLLDNVNHTMDRPTALHSHFLVILQTSVYISTLLFIYLLCVFTYLLSVCLSMYSISLFIATTYLSTRLNVVVEWLAVLEVPCSNLRPETGYPY
jgi:hypothetical protein